MTDQVIPIEAVEATSEAIFIHRSMPTPEWGRSGCGCGETFRTAVERQRHASLAVLTAALPHLRPLVEPVCDCYPGGFSPDSYEGPQHHCPVHGHGNDLPTSECPVCLGERSVIATATNLGRQLGRQEAAEEIAAKAEELIRDMVNPEKPHNQGFAHGCEVMARHARDTGKGNS